MKEGKFKDEIVRVLVIQRMGEPIIVVTDSRAKKETSLEKIARLKTFFKESGTVTGASSSRVTEMIGGMWRMRSFKFDDIRKRMRQLNLIPKL